MLTTATLAAMATFWAPAGAAELQSYTITVLEQIRYDITVDANEESAARTIALLEARRTSRFGNPAWKPSWLHSRPGANWPRVSPAPVSSPCPVETICSWSTSRLPIDSSRRSAFFYGVERG